MQLAIVKMGWIAINLQTHLEIEEVLIGLPTQFLNEVVRHEASINLFT